MSTQRRTRAPRFLVPNKERAVISVEAERCAGTLCILSLTGGTIRMSKQFVPGTLGDINFKTVSGKFLATIQLLDMVNGNVQAFRFVQMGATARTRLEDALKKMQGQGLGTSKSNALDRLLQHAGRILAFGSTK